MSNIYKIWQVDNTDYDTFDSAVVVANSEDEARMIHPRESMSGKEWWRLVGWEAGEWVNPGQVLILQVGTTKLKPGQVICASYNAG